MNLTNKIKLNKKVIVLIGVIGVVFMLFGGNKDTDSTNLSEEQRLEQILSHIEGAGEVKVMLSLSERSDSVFSNENNPKYIGAVILAEGGSKSSVKEKIIKAVNAVTGLDMHRIVVYRLET